MILKIKSCPRCAGDVYIDEDIYGWYEECYQCGYLRFLEKINETGKFVPAKVVNIGTGFDDVIRNAEEQREPAVAL